MVSPVTPARLLEELGDKISGLLESTPARDMEKNVKALLSSGFSRLDLVTREEFEVQKALLQEALARIEALESQARTPASQETPEP
ncbi:MAG: phosphoheptose isomerase [Candidatus Dactylopiibacterium carminicum]|uniref:Ubiquinone biosynthesis accessory factor UbiK n=1 Tax=Candidatus Dactylopiibacterium carminicum TaxID=857335 RepID=A0A272EX22_9RHOO|nr:accessory factor UbiK family protein [Candidatus Dactylopiibacterium carminicum]KAF7600305.1 phosphoheptose isomerase [Candidatus Dactylopiibacterium carminicum]PAS94641.1 MAG: phosphoheptose isomerase [Candidatus Dactylopiibacterium carminicum]PAS96930.1 MAG: phosphoheptose isomerase [Candidatus Dactylopiibacterium carminicum]PAT00307.1 MAG: phosphoheptose isomerase [Candidatus Dactylopiibacterium carminicum]